MLLSDFTSVRATTSKAEASRRSGPIHASAGFRVGQRMVVIDRLAHEPKFVCVHNTQRRTSVFSRTWKAHDEILSCNTAEFS